MKRSFNSREKRLLKRLQGDIPLSATPFADLAKELGMEEEEEVLSLLRNWQGQGVIKRLGALLRHQKSGFVNNAMVVWELPPERMADAGKLLAEQAEISHCYERTPPFLGRFNLFTMIHLQAKSNIAEHVAVLAKKIRVLDYQILKSERELKKTSREYF